MKDRKVMIPVILVLVIAVISLGVAFAAFSTTLTINGSGTVESTNWSIVFEGRTSISTIDAPQTSGTAAEVTRPTIKNSATEISTYSVTLQAPGDSITYKFKIHNKGSFDGNISAMTVSGVSRPSTAISGAALVTDPAVAQANAATLANIEYKFYYEADDTLVGQNAARDCLAVGESEDVVLRIVFAPSDDTSVLPSSNLTLNNLGISMTYTQASSCPSQSGGNNGGNQGNNSNSQYLLGYGYDDELQDYADLWGAKSELSAPVLTFIKRTGNVEEICMQNNNQEQCLEYNMNTTTLQDFTSFCTSVGGTMLDSEDQTQAYGDITGGSAWDEYYCSDIDSNNDATFILAFSTGYTYHAVEFVKLSNRGSSANSNYDDMKICTIRDNYGDGNFSYSCN